MIFVPNYKSLRISNFIAGHRAISFDWPGFGLSDKPSPKAFNYRPADFLKGLEDLVEALDLVDITLVAQVRGPLSKNSKEC
jgi:pimeloyl-ACP methyl ester carboxylesterase